MKKSTWFPILILILSMTYSGSLASVIAEKETWIRDDSNVASYDCDINYCESSLFFESTLVTIGTGTSSSAARGPIQQGGRTTVTRYTRFNQVFTQTELTAAGIQDNYSITELRWFLNSTEIISGSGDAPFRIYMKNSTVTTATPGSWSTLIAGLQPVFTRVFNTSNNFPGETGWLPFMLDVPFIYTGGAIEIAVEFDFGMISEPAFTGVDNDNPNGKSLTWRFSDYPQNVVVRALGSSGYSDNLAYATGSTLPTQRANIQMLVVPEAQDDPPGDCPEEFLEISDQDVTSDVYQAEISITSNGVVRTSSDVSYYAGDNVMLNPDFEVEDGGLFEADIQDCTNSPGDGSGDMSAFELDPNLEPWENFDLTDWAIDTPAPRASDPCRAVRGDEDEWDQFRASTSSPYFFTHTDGGMRFVSPVGGATTNTSCNAGFPRSELREMLRAGNTSVSTTGVNANNWALGYQPGNTNHGGRNGVLTATLRVNEVTTTGTGLHPGRTIIGQIHAENDEPARLYYRKLPNAQYGCIYLEHEIRNGNCVTFNLIGDEQCSGNGPTNGIELDELFSYEIINEGADVIVKVIRGDFDGPIINEVTVDMNQLNSGYDISSEWMYFKAGAYTQNNTGDPDDSDVITFYRLANSHDAN